MYFIASGSIGEARSVTINPVKRRVWAARAHRRYWNRNTIWPLRRWLRSPGGHGQRLPSLAGRAGAGLRDADPGYMSRKIWKFCTEKFDTRNKRKFWLIQLMLTAGTSRLHELHESKLSFVCRSEFIRSKLSNFSAHVSGVAVSAPYMMSSITTCTLDARSPPIRVGALMHGYRNSHAKWCPQSLLGPHGY